MIKECERTAITALTQEDVYSQSNGLFNCPHSGCTAVFSYNKGQRDLQLVEGVRRCYEVIETIAELRRILDTANTLKINPKVRDDLEFRFKNLENEASDEGYTTPVD